MAQVECELHAGTGFPLPVFDKARPPHGEITWVEPHERAVSTSGPCVQMFVDLYVPRCAGEEAFLVARLRDVHGYLPSADADYVDTHDNLAVTASFQIPNQGSVERIPVVVPYVVLPEGIGGLIEVEIALYEPDGTLSAYAGYPIELPEDIDRSPDQLTVLTHTLVALARADGPLQRDDVRTIRRVLNTSFELDDLGDGYLKRVLKIANRTPHSAETLSEVIKLVVPTDAHPRFVSLMYEAAADADGVIPKRKLRFMDDLFATTGIHDTQRHGPARLAEHYRELEAEPGTDLKALKKQYRSLVRDYHPDRVANLAKGFQDFATNKIKRLNASWEILQEALDPRPAESEVEWED